MSNSSMLLYLSWSTLILSTMILIIIYMHPVIMVLFIIMLNIILILNMMMIKSISFLPMLFFMIMISGLLIIFLYFSSTISNEKSWSSSFFALEFWVPIMSIIMLFIFYFPPQFMFLHESFTTAHDPINLSNYIIYPLISMSKKAGLIYSRPLNILTMIAMLMLLIMLFTIIKICTPKIKSMRKML